MLFLSLVLNLFSSYAIASIAGSVLVIFIAYFALIVLNIEILSLFGAIGKNNIILFSILNALFVFYFWKKKKFPILKPNADFVRLKNAFLLDKSLAILLFGFIFALITTFFLAYVMPVLEPDSQTYHFIRAVEFFEHGRLIHYETGDVRGLIMPFNSEIVYCWIYALKSNFRGYGIISFISYIACLFAIVDIFLRFNFSYRKILWTIFILSSFPAIIVQSCCLQTDILIGSLILICIALFLKKNNLSVYFSSLAYCLAVGTKSTAVIMLFGLFFILFAIEIFIFKDRNFSKIKRFLLYSVFNFLIFSSYNYILNYIDFNSPFANAASYSWHKFRGGFSGFIANLIHFFFQAFDFTGFKWGFYLNDYIVFLKKCVFYFLNIDPSLGVIIPWEKVNILSDEQVVGFGILGFLLYLPSLFLLSGKIFFSKAKYSLFYFVFATVFFINIISLSLNLGYLVYSIRFVVSFVMVSSFCIAYTYRKKSLFKPIVVFFALFYMLFLSTNISRMPIKSVFKTLKTSNYNLDEFETKSYRGEILMTPRLASEINDVIMNDFKNLKSIAVFKTTASSLLYLKSLSKKGYKIDFLNVSKIQKYDLNKYDLIIFEGEMQDDKTFNPEDIKIKYKVMGNNIHFDNTDGIQCFFSVEEQNDSDIQTSICLGYDYMRRIKGFKEVETKVYNSDVENGMPEIYIHYFIKE